MEPPRARQLIALFRLFLVSALTPTGNSELSVLLFHLTSVLALFMPRLLLQGGKRARFSCSPLPKDENCHHLIYDSQIFQRFSGCEIREVTSNCKWGHFLLCPVFRYPDYSCCCGVVQVLEYCSDHSRVTRICQPVRYWK